MSPLANRHRLLLLAWVGLAAGLPFVLADLPQGKHSPLHRAGEATTPNSTEESRPPLLDGTGEAGRTVEEVQPRRPFGGLEAGVPGWQLVRPQQGVPVGVPQPGRAGQTGRQPGLSPGAQCSAGQQVEQERSLQRRQLRWSPPDGHPWLAQQTTARTSKTFIYCSKRRAEQQQMPPRMRSAKPSIRRAGVLSLPLFSSCHSAAMPMAYSLPQLSWIDPERAPSIGLRSQHGLAARQANHAKAGPLHTPLNGIGGQILTLSGTGAAPECAAMQRLIDPLPEALVSFAARSADQSTEAQQWPGR
jgi:hypothetical protein